MDIPSLFQKDSKDDTSADETTASAPRTRKRATRGEAGANARTPLSAREANDLREKLVDLLTQGFEDTDKLISITTADKASAAIWSTIDDREIEILADAWIDWGKSSAHGATVVKLVVSQWKRYQVAIILGPRFLETINFYAEHGAALPMKKKRTRAGTQARTSTQAPAPAPVDANTAAEQAQAAHQAQLAARRNLLASGNSEGASHDAA